MANIQKVNIFIAHTPLQNFIANKIVGQYFSSYDFRNILFTSVNSKNLENFDEFNLIDKNSFWRKTINTYRSKKAIEKIIRKEKTSIFISHTSALLDNYFYNSLKTSEKEFEINFFYEGVLYFYEYNQKLKSKEHGKRKIYGFLCNIRYVPNSRIFPFDDPRINKIYSILPKFTLGPKEKITEVSILKENYTSKEGTVLIMGGKPSLLSNREVILIYKEIINYIKKINGPRKVYFKGHHADTSNNFEIANQNQIEIEDITQNSPIEEIIEQYNPKLVMSYPSSGLINLKAMYGEKIDLISYYINEKKEQIEYMEPVFSDLGIQLKLL